MDLFSVRSQWKNIAWLYHIQLKRNLMRDLLLQPLLLLLLHRIKGFFHSSFQGFSFFFLPLALFAFLSHSFLPQLLLQYGFTKLKVEIDREKL